MQKTLLVFVMGILTFAAVFVAFNNVIPGSGEEVSVSSDEYGGPFRHFFQHHKQQKQLRQQRHRKVEMFIGADGQQHQRIIEVEGDE